MLLAYAEITADPCGTYPLNHGLLEECRRNDTLAANETIRIDQCATDNTGEDDAEATAEHLRKISNNSTSCHRTQVCNDLCYGDGVCGETVLVGQHRGIEILASV